jgi:hypothetical protein
MTRLAASRRFPSIDDMKSWIPLLLAVGALLGLTACTSDSTVISEGLGIEVLKIERSAAGNCEVSWRITNPNVVTYVLDRSTHKIFLDGVEIGTITQSKRMGVPARDSAAGVASLTPTSPVAIQKLADVVAAGSASYRVESSIWLLLIDDDLSRSQLVNTGKVPVTAQ